MRKIGWLSMPLVICIAIGFFYPFHDVLGQEGPLQPVRVVTGHIADSKNSPVRGATVTVKGTSRATVTNDNGDFTINAQPGDVLVISSVGYEWREITVDQN